LKNLILILLVLATSAAAEAAEVVLPHLVPGSPVYLRNDSEGLSTATVGETVYLLLPHELLALPVSVSGHLSINVPSNVSAWTVVEDVPFPAVQPSVRFTLNISRLTGLVFVNPTPEEVDVTVMVYGKNGNLVGYFPGRFLGNGHFPVYAGNLMPELPEGEYVGVVSSSSPIVVAAARLHNNTFHSVVVSREK